MKFKDIVLKREEMESRCCETRYNLFAPIFEGRDEITVVELHSETNCNGSDLIFAAMHALRDTPGRNQWIARALPGDPGESWPCKLWRLSGKNYWIEPGHSRSREIVVEYLFEKEVPR